LQVLLFVFLLEYQPLTNTFICHQITRIINQKDLALSTILTAGLGISCAGGILIILNLIQLGKYHEIELMSVPLSVGMAIVTIILISIPLFNLIVYRPLKRNKTIEKYHQSQPHLIKP
jgi:ABC-type nickel/cobalt efflux system permease component RcnA